MKKDNKKDFINIVLIVIFVLLYVIFTTNFFEYLYGSTVDWDCQHWAIPDYFRKLFYSTGDLIPNFAFNLGNGQNIFYFSYYGFLSPIILLSYLFPFVEMVDYIQIVSVVGLIVSAILLYKWILKKYDSRIAMLSTVFFVTLAPILFHSHRHIMFVNYMPFLILGLFGVDKYFSENKRWLLILSVFLTVMTNYFFSVSSIFVIVIYGIYVYIKNKRITLKKFLIDGLKFLIPIFIGVLMASIVILPTFYVILKGRSESNVTIDFISLFRPQINIKKMFYSSYSVGLTFLSLFAIIINMMVGSKREKILSIILSLILVFPIFAYILNGTMYVDHKVFIALIPLVVLVVANSIKLYFDNNSKKILIVPFLIGLFIFLVNENNAINTTYIIEMVIVVSLLFVGLYLNKKKIFMSIAIVISSIISIYSIDGLDILYKKETYIDVKNSMLEDSVSSVLEQDPNVYRITNQNYLLQNINNIPNINYYVGNIYSSTSNKNYKTYFYNNSGNEITERSYGKITSSMNIFYNLHNANKYFIASEYVPVGYEKISDNFYVNTDVLPIIYATSNVISEEYYNSLYFPYNMESDLKNVVVKGSENDDFNSDIKKFYGDFSILEKTGLNISKEEVGYVIDAEKDNHMKLSVSGLAQDDILIIKFDVENDKKCPGDLSIVINGIENVLTCESWKYHNTNTEFNYVISQNEIIDHLDVTFSSGIFSISNIELYKINYEDIKIVNTTVDEFNFSKDNTSGDVIEGNINVSSDGYLYMSIPYDDGFKIYLNDIEYAYEMVDNGFIGIKVEKGFYDVKIKYEAPFFKEGIVISGISFIWFCAILFKEMKKNKKKS